MLPVPAVFVAGIVPIIEPVVAIVGVVIVVISAEFVISISSGVIEVIVVITRRASMTRLVVVMIMIVAEGIPANVALLEDLVVAIEILVVVPGPTGPERVFVDDRLALHGKAPACWAVAFRCNILDDADC